MRARRLASSSRRVITNATRILVVAVALTGAARLGHAASPGSTTYGSGTFGSATSTGQVDAASGTAVASYPLAYPPARGPQPLIGLSYAHTAGPSEVGVGWSLGLPVIERRGVAGTRPFLDADHSKDTYELSGSPLIEVPCNGGATPSPVASQLCNGVAMPHWSNGWWHFRPRVDSGFTLVFATSDLRTWRVLRDGQILEFGSPTIASSATAPASSSDYYGTTPVRWKIVRQAEAYESGAQPRNVVAYQWKHFASPDVSVLTDVFYTPSTVLGTGDQTEYAHHIHIEYSEVRRAQPRVVDTPIWLRAPDWTASTIDVTSKPVGGGARQLVRRYILDYITILERPYLERIRLQGRCDQPVAESPVAGGDYPAYVLPPLTCPIFPASERFEYQPAPSGPYIFGFESNIDFTGAGATPALFPKTGAFVDLNRDGRADYVQSESPPGYTSPQGYPISCSSRVYVNAGTPDFVTFAFEALGNVSGGPALPIFQPDRVTTLGYWNDAWGVSLLSNFANTSVYDGNPVDLYTVRSSVIAAPPTPFLHDRDWRFERTAPGIPTGTIKPSHVLGDADGDGLVDAIFLDESGGGPNPPTYISFARRATTGKVTFTPASPSIVPFHLRVAADAPILGALADINGDGIADYLTTRDPSPNFGDLVYLPGRGDGTFGCSITTAPCEAPFRSPGADFVGTDNRYEIRFQGVEPYPQHGLTRSSPKFAFADFTGDGRSDVATVYYDGIQTHLKIYVNVDGVNFTTYAFDFPDSMHDFGFHPSGGGSDRYAVTITAADLDGNGTNEVIVCGDSHCAAMGANIDAAGTSTSLLPPGGVLTRILHATGATTTFNYQSLSNLELNAESPGQYAPWVSDSNDPADTGRWKRHSPQPAFVVTRVETSSNAPAPHDLTVVSTYDYRDPVFDRVSNRLRGFGRTRVNGPYSSVDTKYFWGGCQSPDDVPHDAAHQCGNLFDDPYEAVNGRAWRVERLGAGITHSMVVTRFGINLGPAGIGGFSRLAYASQVDTYLYDTTSFIPNASPISVNVAGEYSLVAVHLAAPTRLRQRQVVDAEGFVTDAWDDGQVALGEPGAAIDRPIHATSTKVAANHVAAGALGKPQLVETSVVKYDAGGTVVPMVPEPPDRRLSFAYDNRGRMTSSSALLQGTLPLARFHESGDPQATAGEPTTKAIENTTITLSQLTYDDFGNVIKARGPSGECKTLSYTDATNDPYMDAVRSESAWNGWNCLGTPAGSSLTTSYQYDRGLGALTKLTRPGGRTSETKYDRYGRVAEVWGPSPAAGAASVLEETIAYSDFATSPFHWTRIIEKPGANEHVTWSFVSSLGQPMMTFSSADTSAGDGGAWVATQGPELRPDGQPLKWYPREFYSGDPATYTGGLISLFSLFEGSYDPFGRRIAVIRSRDNRYLSRTDIHPLSIESYDAEQIEPTSPHALKSATIDYDGHGRVVRTRQPEGATIVDTRADFSAMGDVKAVERDYTASGVLHTYRRWRRLDSLGHVIENAEPNSTDGYVDDPNAAGSMKAWRYAYDNSGRLVGTRDPRGCGKNIFYDALGRVLAEDYSPCLYSQPPHSPTAATITANNADGTELFNQYDVPEPGQTADYGAINATELQGLLVATRDRGAHTRFAYDHRGRGTGVARRIAKPGATDPVLASRFASHWFRASTSFDDFDRVSSMSTGAEAPELLAGGTSLLTHSYSARGALVGIGGSYGTLIDQQTFNVDGAPLGRRYGDAAQTAGTFTYDDDRRLKTYTFSRAAGPWAATTPAADATTTQAVVLAHEFDYDLVGNITRIADNRTDVWPSGAKPFPRTMDYDDLYRLKSVTYTDGTDNQVSPFSFEESSGNASPLPRVSSASRIQFQFFGYDELGNVLSSFDEQSTSSFDRGLGNVTYAGAKPNRMSASATTAGGTQTSYDAAGNLVDLMIDRQGPCSAPTGKCVQRFHYDWDEVNQLARAQRWDYATSTEAPAFPSLPVTIPSVALSFIYSGGQRVVKTSDDGLATAHTVDIFGSLRLVHTDFTAGDYRDDATTEAVYLPGIGRVIYDPALPSVAGNDQHVLLELGDHLGSATVVIDRATSEVVEYATYQAYGATESDYRPERWRSFREDMRFTGKEEDIEVGLQYFGARYYSPYLARFISPDPLTVHAMASDLNPYAYVAGAVFNATDPFGLEPCRGKEQCGGQTGDDRPGERYEGGGGAPDVGGFLKRIFGADNSNGRSHAPGYSAYQPPPPPTPGGSVASGITNPALGLWAQHMAGTPFGHVVEAAKRSIQSSDNAAEIGLGLVREKINWFGWPLQPGSRLFPTNATNANAMLARALVRDSNQMLVQLASAGATSLLGAASTSATEASEVAEAAAAEGVGPEAQTVAAPSVWSRVGSFLRTLYADTRGGLRVPGRTTFHNDTALLYRNLQKYNGISPELASERLHAIKQAAGLGPADNALFDLSGGVYHPETREFLGTITEGGGGGFQ